jgi:hypothetical protein
MPSNFPSLIRTMYCALSRTRRSSRGDFDHARDEIGRLGRVFDVGNHVCGEENKIAIIDAVMLSAGVEKLFRVAADHALAGHCRRAVLRREVL